MKWGSLLILLALIAVFWVKTWRDRLDKLANDEFCTMKTRLELSAQLRLLRQYYLSNGALPPHPEEYLRPYLKDNKRFPRGCDFWGSPYRVEQFFDYFGVRSAGPNGRWNDADDLLAAVKIKELASDR